MPRFRKQIDLLRGAGEKPGDFEIFKAVAQSLSGREDFDSCVTIAEMRHFLALAYSAFQLEVDRLALDSWRWLPFVRGVKGKLRTVVSFNYDLIVERLLETCGVSFGRIGIDSVRDVVLLKPHGSIDAALHPRSIVVSAGYPLANCIDRNDAPIVRLAAEHWLAPRVEVDIVLPMEESPYLGFQWVSPGYERFRHVATKLDCLILIGLSYWDVDRPEIDFLLNCMHSNAAIVVVNPNPSPDLITRLKPFGTLKVTNGPAPLDDLLAS